MFGAEKKHYGKACMSMGESGMSGLLSDSSCKGLAVSRVPQIRESEGRRGMMNARRLTMRLIPSLLALAVVAIVGVGSASAAPPSAEEESALDVSSTSATLRAKLDPNGSETTYRFEYGTSGAYGAKIPVPDGAAGSGVAGVSVAAHVQGLSPSTVYHYRVVVLNGEGEARGTDQTFTTEPAGAAFVLPDGRQWELVSPATKYGAIIEPITFEGSPVQAAAEGDGMAYAANAPTELNPEGSRSPEAMELLAERGSTGWSSKDITPQHEGMDNLFIGDGQEYRDFSPDLSQSIVEPRGPTLLSPEATESTIYLRNSASGVFKPLVTASNVAPGVKLQFGNQSVVEFDAATPELSHIVLSAVVPLTEGAAERSLYEWTNGQLQLVGVLPDGAAAVPGNLGYPGNDEDLRHAVSDNGQYVIFTESTYTRGSLYLRDATSKETIELDTPQGGSGSAGHAQFEDASSDGTRVFFTDSEQLTGDSHAQSGQSDLYESSVEPGAKLSGGLTDISTDPNSGEPADVQGEMPGASEDGSYVYFVARGRLTNEPRPACLAELTAAEREAEAASQEGKCRATPGGDNLYLSRPEDGSPSGRAIAFIATLTKDDGNDWSPEFPSLTSRVSPDGSHIAFMSDAQLTSYDNRDASTGLPDEEVYTYDAKTTRLICASCDPTGERPTGLVEVEEEGNEHRGPKYDIREFWRGQGLAANIPGWTGVTLESSLYQSRYLENDGRLFFNSVNALVPQDTDGEVDVYEYEPAGVGACSTEAATYSPSSEGCVNLVSSGTSSQESAFLDASESGNDVFFLSEARLVSEDYDDSFDVYDAHVCSDEMPCLAEPSMSLPCTTADSCREAPGPQPATFGPPPSATFSGTGNVVPVSVKTPVVTKKATSAKKLASALKACRKRRGKRRAACESRARKRLSGSSKSSRRASKGGK